MQSEVTFYMQSLVMDVIYIVCVDTTVSLVHGQGLFLVSPEVQSIFYCLNRFLNLILKHIHHLI